MQQDRPTLDELTERLEKAQGHINAVERRLWDDPERGVWSAHQAVARVAEAWFRLCGEIPALPPMGKYLPRELLQHRLDEFESAAAATPLAVHLREIAVAEEAVLTEPFPKLQYIDRPALMAGLSRKNRYLDALRALVLEIEDAIADQYLVWQRGDWARLPNGNVGLLFDRTGLAGWFLIPSIAMESPAAAIKGWALPHPAVTPVEPDPDGPIAVPAYYWLLEANRNLADLRRLTMNHSTSLDTLEAGLNALLDAAAKAWLIDRIPPKNRVCWSYVCARDHLQVLSEMAPPAVATPLIEAQRRGEDLAHRARQDFRRMPPGWLEETAQILDLARAGIHPIGQAVRAQLDPGTGRKPGAYTVV